jgi:hypothetical protein
MANVPHAVRAKAIDRRMALAVSRASAARIEPLEQRTLLSVAVDEPAFKDFMGVNTHAAAGFDVNLYGPVFDLVRDYHNLNWDITNDTSRTQTFPYAANGVNWDNDYGKWVVGGFKIDSSIQVENFGDAQWKDPAADAYKYGYAFAKYFGSTGKNEISSVEIGNEVTSLSDSVYMTIFKNMAQGIRDADPNMKIATCNLTTGASGTYAKSVSLFVGSENLVDIYNVHSYPFLNLYPTWERSFPEDTRLTYLTDVQNIITWQNAHDPTAQTWLTEFGYDTTTKPNPTTGTFSQMKHVTETQMAQYLVRSWLNFSAMDLDRAYMFYYNDSDSPTLFGGSGLTRNFQPKPAYYAVQHLQQTLGNYKFSGAIQQNTNGLYVFAFEKSGDPTDQIWVAWSATGTGTSASRTISGLPGAVTSAEIMPLVTGPATAAAYSTTPGSITLDVGETPTYIHISVNGSIGGVVFNDANGNGVKDAGDAGIQGRTVYEDANNNNVLDAGEQTATTDINGAYSLIKLIAGNHYVREIVPAGWAQTTSAGGGSILVSVPAGQAISGKNFGVWQPAVVAAPITLQGEAATFSGGTKKATNHAGYLGTGFADFGGNLSSVQWTFTNPTAELKKLQFRYANANKTNRPTTVYVNNVNVGVLNFAPTGSWTTWVTTSLNATLTSGTNTIKLVAGSAGGPNLDQLVISSATTSSAATTLAATTEVKKKKLVQSL